MLRLFIVLAISSFLFISCGHHKSDKPVPTVHKGYNFKLKIPSEWIEKLRHYNYKQNNVKLLRELDSLIQPNKIFVPDEDEDLDTNRYILNPIFANLDGESANELVCLVGWDETYPSITVFKEIKGDWYLLYVEPFYMFYTMPELIIANNFAKNKTFYTRQLYDRGSGEFYDGYSFYKLVNNKVYKCLELPHEARIYGWGLYLNQEVTMDFNVNGGNTDEIWAYFHYNFFPGAINKGDMSWDGHTDISLVKGEDGINYQWDSVKFAYKPKDYKNGDSTMLNAQKVACFGAFGNDSLFVHAFHAEINKTLQTGTRQQKRILKDYLARVKQTGHATTEELEETTEAGGTKFYGVKKKKKIKSGKAE